MNPVYKIQVSYEPAHDDDSLPYVARAYRLSDDALIHVAWQATATAALELVRSWMASQAQHRAEGVFFTDEDGNLIETHSVRA